MARLHKGFPRYALVRLGGFVALLVGTAIVLAMSFDAGSGAGFAGYLVGDFGTSADAGTPVGSLIAERLGVTLPLALLAMVLAFLIGVPAGAIAALRSGSVLARGIGALGTGATALPAFWAGMVLVVLLAGVLRWLPPGGFIPWEQGFGAAFASLLMPAFALAIPLFGMLIGETRRHLAAAADSPTSFGARLVGLTLGQALRREILARAIIPAIALLGRSFGLILASTMIVENVFYLPGLGRLAFAAIAGGDSAVIAGIVFAMISMSALVRLAVEVGLAALDPRRIRSVAS